MIDPVSLATLYMASKVIGTIMTIGGLAVGVFKVINWIKTKLSNIDSNVVALKDSMDTHITGLRDDIKLQTSTIATALSEQRADFRTFYGPAMMMQFQTQLQQNAVPMRAKRAVKKPAKKK